MKRIVTAALVAIFPLATGAWARDDRFDRRWEIWLIHHTHFDIGYTHPQDEVMRLQWKNLELALDLMDESEQYPDDARFRWNPESMWVVETWLEQACPADRERFMRRVQEGSLGLDALFANLLTELCRPEELWQALAFKFELERMTGVPIDSAMTTDVPGATSGLVTALAQAGVRYLSMGPNRTHRIGFTLKEWADRPFYWVSASGREKILCFVHGKGYSWFHTGLNYKFALNKFTPDIIFPYLHDLERAGYPYDIIPIRYNIGSDNGPPDPNISKLVQKWNETYPHLRVRLSTVSETFREFERRYGDRLPSFSGDFTPYWPDGAASTARETALARNASETLDQLQTLWTLARPREFPAREFHRAWQEVLLFNEHTWGAWNSISNPDSDFAVQQWEWKRQRALEAAAQSYNLFARLAETLVGPEAKELETVSVINTHSWPVSGPVLLAPSAWPGPRVETAEGKPVPSQLLSDGSLVFIASDVPGLSAQTYRLVAGSARAPGAGRCEVSESMIANDSLELRLDPDTGAIASIKDRETGREYVNDHFRDQFNEYVYIRGRLPQVGRVRRPSRPTFRVVEPGPVLCRLEITREAFNTNRLATTLTMYEGLRRIELGNELDRPRVRKKEGIHFAFPVAVEDPVVRYDLAWGSAAVGRDPLPGAKSVPAMD
jgi:hypothetical protein